MTSTTPFKKGMVLSNGWTLYKVLVVHKNGEMTIQATFGLDNAGLRVPGWIGTKYRCGNRAVQSPESTLTVVEKMPHFAHKLTFEKMLAQTAN